MGKNKENEKWETDELTGAEIGKIGKQGKKWKLWNNFAKRFSWKTTWIIFQTDSNLIWKINSTQNKK